MTLFLTAVAPASALDTTGMDIRYLDSFDNPGNWSNPQGTWQIGPSPNEWGTGNVAYTGSNHVPTKNKPQNLVTDLDDPINLSEYRTVILQFDTSVTATKRGSQSENVIVTDANGVPHIVWAKSKATFSGIQQVDISSIVAGNKSINLTFQYMKKGKPVSGSQWQVDDVLVLGNKTGEKPYSTVQFNKSVYTVKEGDGVYAVLNLTRTLATPGTVTVNWTAMDGTALAGVNYGTRSDYLDYNVNGTVTFSGSEMYKLIQVPILDDSHYSVPDRSFNVTIEDVTDPYLNTISGTPAVAEVVINDADSTLAVEVTMPETAEVNEGSTWTASGSFTDLTAAAPWTAIVNYGDGSGDQTLVLNGDKTFDLSYTYADDNVYTVTVTVTNNDRLFGSDYTIVTVNNIAPTLTLDGASSVDAGATYTLSLSSSDPGDDTITSWSINWGDGNVETVTGNPTSATHVYAAGPNDYVISATATDEDGTWDAGNTVKVHVNMVIESFPIRLVQGWNIISEPLLLDSEDASVESFFEPVMDNVIIIWKYDAASGTWLNYVPNAEGNDLTTIDEKSGYLVMMNGAASFTIYGQVPDEESIHLYSTNGGWNIIGHPSLNSKPTGEEFSGIAGKYNIIWGFDRISQTWMSYVYDTPGNDLLSIGPGEGYLIMMNEDADYMVG